MSETDAFIKSIDSRLSTIEKFIMEDYAEDQKATEHRLTVVETRIYVICGLMLAIFQGPGLVKAVLAAI